MDRGEPAFPSTRGLATGNGTVVEGHPGMALRDHFAGLAMQGILAGPAGRSILDDQTPGQASLRATAELSYEMAEFMMEARKP